jgi:hypothetical protein
MDERPVVSVVGPATVVMKTVVTHTVTYALVGMLALVIGDYASFYADTDLRFVMRPTTDPILVLAPTLQLLRGAMFGLLFYVLREPFFARQRGWLVLWAVLVGVGIVGTFGPAPGSLEGLFFTTFPLAVHLRGLPEVLLQSFLLATVLFYWVNHPHQRWLTWVMGLAFVLLAFVFPLLGLLVGSSD